MKNILIFSLLAVFCLNVSATCAPQQTDKSKLRVLYVGGNPDMERGGEASVKERMASFEKMLNNYFTSVTVVHADDYTQQMSYDYDVTVMDGRPKEITPMFMDQEKGIYLKPGYFTEDFDKPILTIGALGDELGRRIGTKNDWYCLCLDADALGWREGHPIFKGPFEVKMTVVNKPTPADAFHYAHFFDGNLPAEIPMWKVQTKGYATDEGFPIGLVSRAWGYEDSPEAEIISGGVSSKSLDAVAIGRHGNWFHWGFAASPTYLTDEAQSVLANAIVYISQFDGQGLIARKYSDRIATREILKEMKFIASEEMYAGMTEMTEKSNKVMAEEAQKAKAKQARGEELDEREKMLLNFKPADPTPRETILQMYMPAHFARFGTDSEAYARYFDENRDYFFDGSGNYQLVVDEDAKSLGIPNNDIRLLDEAIKMLEAQRETDKARRILTRYTLVDFGTAKEWREWFGKNRNNMFFTESGGWIWLINSREPGVNDYRVWEARRVLSAVEPGETNDNNPVAVAASLETLQSGEKAVYIKIKVHPGYHIYNYVAFSDPFIATKIEVEVPDGYSKVGELQMPSSKYYNQSGTTIWDGTIVFTQIITGSGPGTVECKINYQSCANDVCFPPAEVRFSL